MREIYTIGHSTKGIGEFIEILKSYEIEIVVDVRHFPKSKRHPWFNKENLENELREGGIEYAWIEELGGFRKGGYLNYMESEEWLSGFNKLLGISERKRLCIMCAEWNVMACHRWYISEFLNKRNYEVIHIINKKKFWNHRELPKKKLRVLCDKLAAKAQNI